MSWILGASGCMKAETAIALYALFDSRSNEIRYIGYSKSPGKRFGQHCNPKGKLYKDRWIRKMKVEGTKPELLLLGYAADYDQACRIEIALIAAAKRLDWRLTNATDGGEGTSG